MARASGMPRAATIAIVAAVAAPLAAYAAVINQVVANRGSLAGGTYIQLFGSGFNRDGRQGVTRV
jgi:hypothetical protein